jgi:protein SCO1/2
MQILQRIMPERAQLVSFSVDPTRDTPEVLAEFAQTLGRIEGKWIFATGKPAEIEKLTVHGFFLGEEGELLHSTRLALVDSRSHLRGFYESSDENAVAQLLRDLTLLSIPRK